MSRAATKQREELETTIPQALAIVEWTRANGSDATNVRDAAHEASHALELDCESWDRATIDDAARALRPGESAASEVLARAVEQLVCEALGIQHNWDEFMLIACLEAAKVGRPFPGPGWMTKAVAQVKSSQKAKDMAARILAMEGA
jgi:hypothetical protein